MIEIFRLFKKMQLFIHIWDFGGQKFKLVHFLKQFEVY